MLTSPATRIKATWADVNSRLDFDRDDVAIYDHDGNAWHWVVSQGGYKTDLRRVDTSAAAEEWHPDRDEEVYLDPPPLPEPPDKTRIEFESGTDVYAAWRDDASSAQAGYVVGDGGEVWCLFGSSVPQSWLMMWLEFGDALELAVRLVPHSEDVGNYANWPTALMAAAEKQEQEL